MRREVEMELWFYEDQFRALSTVLEAQDSSVEKQLREKFDELYETLVPPEIRQSIRQRDDMERAAQAAEMEAARVFSAFHITERGQEEYFQLDQRLELLDAARYLRRYLRQEPGAEKGSFPELFPGRERVTAERFDQLVGLYMENTGKTAGTFELDFDKREFSVVHISDGWKSFSMDDISTAAYHAFRKEWISAEDRWARLMEKLDGKEIASVGHLSASDVAFKRVACETHGLLSFCLETDFDVDTIFEMNVTTGENDDWVNVYANYDMSRGIVCDDLEIALHHGDDGWDCLVYSLDAAEKAIFLRKMDDYCQQQTGQSLERYSQQLMAEDIAPPTGPVM